MAEDYDTYADQYAKYRTSPMGVEQLKRWLPSISSNGTVLDLGCGSGRPLTTTLEENGFDVVGVDSSPRMIEISRSNLARGEFICTPVQKYSFPEIYFDAALCWGLMFLLNEADQEQLIFNTAKTLKPSGQFLFTSPAIACEWEDVLTKMRSVSLGRERYVTLLERAGLSICWESEDEGQSHYYAAAKNQ
jgi:SAM-dependent methyltransferase